MVIAVEGTLMEDGVINGNKAVVHLALIPGTGDASSRTGAYVNGNDIGDRRKCYQKVFVFSQNDSQFNQYQ